MTDEYTMKLTDFDHLTGDRHLQMIKAALPYVNVSQQRVLSFLVKFWELRKTMTLFQEEPVAAMGISTVPDEQKSSPLDMMRAMQPYGSPQEQDFIQRICNFIQGLHTANQYSEVMTSHASFPGSFRSDNLPAGTVSNGTIPSDNFSAGNGAGSPFSPDSFSPGNGSGSPFPSDSFPAGNGSGSPFPSDSLPAGAGSDDATPSATVPAAAMSGVSSFDSGTGDNISLDSGSYRPVQPYSMPSPIQQLKGFLPPDQQARFDQAAFLMQTLQHLS